jgi:hypothetical protein
MRFKIYASEITYYVAEVDADNEDDALNNVPPMTHLNAVNFGGYQVDKIEVIGE